MTVPISRTPLLLLLLVSAFFWNIEEVASDSSNDGSCVISVTADISLGTNPNDAFQAETFADYYAPCNDDDNDPSPLIVFATGGPATRKLYTLAATALANRGYGVMVVDHVLPFGSVVYAWDLNTALQYAVDNFPGLDENRIAYVGHSQGHVGVLWALSEQCPVPFCGAVDLVVPLDPRVKAAAGYSAVVYNPFSGGFVPSTNNAGFPYLYLIGAGDSVTVTTDEATGEVVYQGSFDRQTPIKVMALIDNMDHHSIADQLLSERTDVLSTRPRQEQVEVAVEAIDLWLEEQFECDDSSDEGEFCETLSEHGEEDDRLLLRRRKLGDSDNDVSFVITECQEVYSNT